LAGIRAFLTRTWRWLTSQPDAYWAARVFGIKSIRDLQALTPAQFEQFVAFLFRYSGFEAQVVGHSGDEGIDIELRLKSRGQLTRAVAQCKRYQGSVGQPIVRGFFGSFSGQAIEGYLVTTSTFTRPAIAWASTRPIRLIDGAALLRWTEEVARIRGHVPQTAQAKPTRKQKQTHAHAHITQ
jgi:restriction endonuclease Mrr